MAVAAVINFHKHRLTTSSTTAREPPPPPQPPELPPPAGDTVDRQRRRILETLRPCVSELLHLIFTYLLKSSLAACARVNRSWFAIVIERREDILEVEFGLQEGGGFGQLGAGMFTSPTTKPPETEPNAHQTPTSNSSSTSLTTTRTSSPSHTAVSRTSSPNSLYPSLRSLLGSTSHNFAEGCQNAEFLVPFRPLHGLIRPLTKVYRTEPLALSLVATTSSEVVMDTSDPRPSIWFEFKRNPILRRVEFTRRSRRVVRDDWDKVVADAPGAGRTKQTFPWHLKPPIRHLTLRAFDVHFVFTRLVDKRMFGPVTQIRQDPRQYEPTESRSSRSEYLPRLVDTEDELAEETGSEVAPWEGKTVKDGGDAIVDDQDVAVTSTLLETASFDDDVSHFDDNLSFRTVLGDRSTRPTPLIEAALAEMCASSRDFDLAFSPNSSTTRSSQSPPSSPPGFETDEYPDLDALSTASGLSRRSAVSFSSLLGLLYNTESSTDDDDASGGAGAEGGGNPLGLNFFNDNYTSEDDSASDADLFASGGAFPQIDPLDRAFLRLVAESCLEMEMLALEEAWDFDRLTAEDAGGAVAGAGVAAVAGTRGEPEVGLGTLSRVRLRVNLRSVEDAEERTDVLLKGTRRVMTQKGVNTERPKCSRSFFMKPR
ncbi:hypothetical protein FRB90_011258 [Tulasnella sp. 427]|nr:hypothetical protein FRB90_011258 [Tulasnella sp. 427]